MKAGTAGGIEAVVNATNTHIGNADACRCGCIALCNMTSSNSKTLIKQTTKGKWTAENRVKAGATGGIEAVVKAINVHINNH